MKLSIVLPDASFREMLHTPIYLNRQNINRKDYEIIWIYNKENPILKEYKDKGILDKYIILKQPKTKYYKWPLLLNEAILQSEGDILCVMDGDAICSPNFILSIISSFEQFKNIILYIDEVRHAHREWCWPVVKEWNEIMQIFGSKNWHNWGNNRTTGIDELIGSLGTTFLDINTVPIGMYNRNYGACFSSLKADLVKVGGFDEHEGFEGFYTGSWEAGWRMLPFGFIEYWHPTEFLIHPHHPDTDGYTARSRAPPRPDEGNPYMNSYSIKRLRGRPWVENERIRNLRLNVLKHW